MATIPKGAGQKCWTPPKGRWTRGDGEQMLGALATSGLSARRFAEEHGLSAQRVYWWRDRLRSQRDWTQSAPPALIPVRIVEQERREGQDGALEIVLRGSTVVRVPRRVDLGWLREVVAALEEGTC